MKNRTDRIGTEMLSILFQFYYCYKNNYYLKYDSKQTFNNSNFMKTIYEIIDNHNSKFDIVNTIAEDKINIPGPGNTDMCYGMGMIVQELEEDMLTFFKKNFYKNIHECLNLPKYNIPFDIENSIVIHLRLDDQWWESDYDGNVCSSHFINLINNKLPCHFTNGPNNNFNKQNPLSSCKIKKQLNILLEEFPKSKIIIIASPLTKIPDLEFDYDMLIQSEDYNYDLFLLSKSKKIILSRSNFALISLFFGEQTHIHMPLWGHFACAGFGTKYDKCNFNYFY
jgi:hypothetical protein